MTGESSTKAAARTGFAVSAGVLLLLASSGCQFPPLERVEPPPGFEFKLGMPSRGGQGLPHVRKQVRSWRAQRFENVVAQQVDFSCGAASLATLLRYYYGDPIDERDVMVEMLETGDQDKIRREGFSLLDMKRYVESRGYQAMGYAVTPEVLEQLKIPAITLVNTRGYSHFVVLKGARDGFIYVADPALGNRSMPQSEFLEEWSGAIFFVAAKREDGADSPLDLLEASLSAPDGAIREIPRQNWNLPVFINVVTRMEF